MAEITEAAFRDEVVSFLDANATPRDLEQKFVWGEGSDAVALFDETSREVEQKQLAEAKRWRALRYDAGLGWLSGPEQYGGRELPASYERYLVNDIRRKLGFDAVPVRVVLKSPKNPFAKR